jgi:23S rRNA pseudouridine2605 synthase
MERIQKIIASQTSLSRRKVEELIKDGKVQVNNKTAILGDKALITDNIKINGKTINLNKFQDDKTRVLMLNKPTGVICSTQDDKDREVVFDLLPKDNRWVMVGRLDINTSGLLLFTNSGELAHKLMHPSSNIDREYAVRVLGKVEDEHLRQLKNGLKLEDDFAKFKQVEFLGGEGYNTWYKVVITEGRNREVRRMWEHLGFKISRLMRVRFADINLPKSLKARQILELKPAQVENLQRLVGSE